MLYLLAAKVWIPSDRQRQRDLQMDDIEKNLMTLWYRNDISCCRSDNVSDMNNRKKLKDCEKIAKQIAKSDLIRKKYRALKTSKIEEDIGKTL